MRDVLKSLYNIEPKLLVKYTNKVYKVSCDDETYCLKYIDNVDNDKVLEKLNYLDNDCFLLPHKNNIRTNRNFYNNKQFYLYDWLNEDEADNKDLKLKYYLNRIGKMHNQSSFTSNVAISYYKELKMQIEEKQQETYALLEKEISQFEKDDYHSPFEWNFLNNYHIFIESLDKSKKYLEQFSKLTENKSIIRQVITHQNFSYDHVFLNKNKISGNEKMKIASPVEEFTSLFNNCDFKTVDFSGCFNEYLKNNELDEVEKNRLLSLLFININKKTNDDFSSLVNLNQSLYKIKSIEEIVKILNV